MAELTMDQKYRILRDVSLGVEPPEHESDEARKYRALMEEQVEANREHGMSNDIPWDP